MGKVQGIHQGVFRMADLFKGRGVLRLAWLFLFSVAVAGATLCALRHFMPGKEYRQASDHIWLETGVPEGEAEVVSGYIEELPPVLKSLFMGDGDWKVAVVKEIDEGVGGRTIMEEKTVYIKEGLELEALHHEFAHIYLDWNPVGEEFGEIFREEAKSLTDAYYGGWSYCSEDATEYYCTAWQTVLKMNGHDTLHAAPKTFAYFTELFGSLFA